ERHPNAYAHSKIRVNDAGVDEIFVRGSEREVMNHIGVVAPAAGEEVTPVVAATQPGATHTQPVVVEPPRAPVVRLGRSREVLFPVAGAVAIVSPFFLAWLLWRRRKRKLLAKRAAAGT